MLFWTKTFIYLTFFNVISIVFKAGYSGHYKKVFLVKALLPFRICGVHWIQFESSHLNIFKIPILGHLECTVSVTWSVSRRSYPTSQSSESPSPAKKHSYVSRTFSIRRSRTYSLAKSSLKNIKWIGFLFSILAKDFHFQDTIHVKINILLQKYLVYLMGNYSQIGGW